MDEHTELLHVTPTLAVDPNSATTKAPRLIYGVQMYHLREDQQRLQYRVPCEETQLTGKLLYFCKVVTKSRMQAFESSGKGPHPTTEVERWRGQFSTYVKNQARYVTELMFGRTSTGEDMQAVIYHGPTTVQGQEPEWPKSQLDPVTLVETQFSDCPTQEQRETEAEWDALDQELEDELGKQDKDVVFNPLIRIG